MANTIDMFPNRIRAVREKIGLSQEQFAKALGLVRATIGYYETGGRKPDIDILNKIVDITGCSVEYLMGYTASMNPIYEKEVIATGLDEETLRAIRECDTDTLGFMVKSKHFEKMTWLISAISDPIFRANMEEEEFAFYCFRISDYAKQIAIDITKDENIAAVRMAQREGDGHYMDLVKEYRDSLAHVKKGRDAANNIEQNEQNCFLSYDLEELPTEVLEGETLQVRANTTPASDTKQEVTARKRRGRPKATPDDEITSRLMVFKQKMKCRGGEENGMQTDKQGR